MSEKSQAGGRMVGWLALLFVALFAAAVIWQSPLFRGPPPAVTEGPHLSLQLKDGVVDIELRPDLAPNHVARIMQLADQGFYDGLLFHRVIEGFMAQTGDPTGTGAGGSDLPDLAAEFNATPFERGTLGMARSASPDSANSQFFITLADAPHLNGQYTAFGRVVSGMEFVDRIKKGATAANGLVTDPDAIVSMRSVAGDNQRN